MNKVEFDALIRYIDARIADYAPERECLYESLRTAKAKEALAEAAGVYEEDVKVQISEVDCPNG